MALPTAPSIRTTSTTCWPTIARARAQQALFDPSGGAVTGYDEFVDAAGNVRPSWVELAECVGERGRAGLEQLRTVVRSLVDNDGITYIQADTNGEAITNGDGTAVPGRGTSTRCRW